MKSTKSVSMLVVLTILLFGSSLVLADSDTTLPATPDGRPMPGPALSGICTDGLHLYVLAGPMVYQYSLPDLTLSKSLEIPRPQPPATQE